MTAPQSDDKDSPVRKWEGEVMVPRQLLAEIYRGLKRHYEMLNERKMIDALLSKPVPECRTERTMTSREEKFAMDCEGYGSGSESRYSIVGDRTPEPEHADIPAAYFNDLWEYHLGVSGQGKHAFTWSDKPHRLVYDLTRKLADERASRSERMPIKAREFLETAACALEAATPDDCCGMADNGESQWPIKDEIASAIRYYLSSER